MMVESGRVERVNSCRLNSVQRFLARDVLIRLCRTHSPDNRIFGHECNYAAQVLQWYCELLLSR